MFKTADFRKSATSCKPGTVVVLLTGFARLFRRRELLFIVMYKPSTEGLINGNYLEKRRGDESPRFIRAAHRSVVFDDIDIQPTSEKPLHRESARLSKREKWMIAGLILLAVLCIVFIVLFAKAAKGREKASQMPENKSKEWISAASGECVRILGVQQFINCTEKSPVTSAYTFLKAIRTFNGGAF